MASYEHWNAAIAEYFVSGLPTGATVYLSVDDDSIADIGLRFLRRGPGNTDWVEDFLSAVRAKCVVGDEVRLGPVQGASAAGLPRCVAFLGALVLAAHRMAGEEVTTESNYFTPLRQVLGLTDSESGRPRGLQSSGSEEPLWLAWNQWIVQKGFLPSAERGNGSTKYIHYPLSQALLREGDKRRLGRVFREAAGSHRISKKWDRGKLSAWLRMNVGLFNTQHFRQLFQEAEPRRYEAIVDAVFDLYDTLDWTGKEQSRPAAKQTVQRHIMAGLYRAEDPLAGSINYFLYPREPKRWKGAKLYILYDGQSYLLREERPGWFIPLWTEDPSGGRRYDVSGDPEVKELTLPERDFWILVRDPENEDSGVLASWCYPGIFERFILLCRKEHAQNIERLRQGGLLRWDYEFPLPEPVSGWVEYRECVITSLDWGEVLSESNDLFDALWPSASATIALRGGLRVPQQRGWLEGYGPEVAIYAFEERMRFVVHDILNIDVEVMDKMIETNQYFELPELTRGDYLLQVYGGSRMLAQRAFRILPWRMLSCAKPEQSYSVRFGSFTLQGGLIRIDGGRAVVSDNTVQMYVEVYTDADPQIVLDKLRRVVERQKFVNRIPFVKCAKHLRGRFYFYLGVAGWNDVGMPEEVRRLLELLGLERFINWPIDINDIQSKLSGQEIETHYFKPIEGKAATAGVISTGIGYTSVGINHLNDPFDISDTELPENDLEDGQAGQRFDQLLYWLSARAEGSWDVFAQACHLLRLVKEPRQVRHVQRRLILLGHVESSADGARWSICPAAIVRSQSGENFLCGQRTPELLEELSAQFGIVDRPQPDYKGPTHLAISGLSLDEGKTIKLKGEIALTAAGTASEKLATLLPDLAEWQDKLTRIEKLNPYNYEIERWNGASFSPCHDISERNNIYTGESGMYHLTHNTTGVGMTLYFDRVEQKWLKGDWYGLRFLTYYASGMRCEAVFDTVRSELRIPIAQHWPLLYERALVLSSGFLPRRNKVAGLLIYQIISANLSNILAEKLNVSVEVKHHA